MKVILTHIGGEPPPYVEECLRQFRIFNRDIPVAFIGAKKHLEPERAMFRDLDVEAVFAEDLESDARIQTFRQCDWFKDLPTPRTSYPSQPGFWQLTTERLFFVSCLMERNGLTDVFHFENDVLIYRDLREILAGIGRCGKDGLFITPSGDYGVTSGLLFADHPGSLREFADFVLRQAVKSKEAVKKEFGTGGVSDSTLLKVFGRQTRRLNFFPILPRGSHAYDFPAFGSVFDPNSWGQFAGGTNNGHPPGYAAAHHFVGRELLNGNYGLCWEGGDLAVPFAVDRRGRKTRINNLHIHSKRLAAFASRQTGTTPREQPRSPLFLKRPGLLRRLRSALPAPLKSLARRITRRAPLKSPV